MIKASAKISEKVTWIRDFLFIVFTFDFLNWLIAKLDIIKDFISIKFRSQVKI